MSSFSVKQSVVLHSLKANPDLNGRRAVIVSPLNPETGRIGVHVLGGSAPLGLNVKPVNLDIATERIGAVSIEVSEMRLKQDEQRLMELWLQSPKEVVVGLEGWHKTRAPALSGLVLSTNGQCGLAPIIAGLEKWENVDEIATLLVTLRCKCHNILDCTRFYHIMEHLEDWDTQRAFDMMDIWWFLATGDDEPRPAVDYWLSTLWSDKAKIAAFSKLAEDGGWGEEDEEEDEDEDEEDSGEEEESQPGTDLILAAKDGDVRKIIKLLDAGADVNAGWEEQYYTTHGTTALQEACEYNHLSCVALLLERRANVDLGDYDGQTALMAACRTNHDDCARLLLKAGASLDLADNLGRTPLLLASGNKAVDCVRLLVKAAASVNLPSSNGMTPLMGAACSGSFKSMNILLKAGANVNAVEKLNRTALHWARKKGHARCEELCIQHGAKEVEAMPEDDKCAQQ